MFQSGKLNIGGAGKWDNFFVFCNWVYQKIFCCFIPIKICLPFIWGIAYFCTMDGFLRILKKTLSKLICTQLYITSKRLWPNCVLQLIACTRWIMAISHRMYLNQSSSKKDLRCALLWNRVWDFVWFGPTE